MRWGQLAYWWAGVDRALGFPGEGMASLLFAAALLGGPAVIAVHALGRMWGREQRYAEVLGWAVSLYLVLALRLLVRALPYGSQAHAILRPVGFALGPGWVIWGAWRIVPALGRCRCGRGGAATAARPQRRITLKLCLLGGLVMVALFALAVGAAHLAWNAMHRPFLDRVQQVRTARNEQRVKDLLGEPTAVYETGEPVDWDAEYPAYGHPRGWRPDRRVLVFLGPSDRVPSDYIVFVQMGADGGVADVYMGGT